MELINPLTTARARSLFYELETHTASFFDNVTSYVVVGDQTRDFKILVEYDLRLAVSGRGRVGNALLLIHGGTVDLDDEYLYSEPVVTGITVSATIVGDEVRLNFILNSVGENVDFLYRISRLP